MCNYCDGKTLWTLTAKGSVPIPCPKCGIIKKPPTPKDERQREEES